MAGSELRTLQILDVGRQPYTPVMELQERVVAERQNDDRPDTLILVEHEPVYTMGRRAVPSNVVASDEQLTHMGIEVVETGRGGDVTYHGPGQLVGYPILKLDAGGQGPVWYVSQLERAIIGTLAAYGIESGTDEINRGVWIGEDKIAAIGVRITRHVSMHGFALNVTTDLGHYAGIIPCGLQERGVTSLEKLVPGVDLESVKERFVAVFADVFGFASCEPEASPLGRAEARS